MINSNKTETVVDIVANGDSVAYDTIIIEMTLGFLFLVIIYIYLAIKEKSTERED